MCCYSEILEMADIGRSSIEDDFMYGSNVASCHVYIRMRMLTLNSKQTKILLFFFRLISNRISS